MEHTTLYVIIKDDCTYMHRHVRGTTYIWTKEFGKARFFRRLTDAKRSQDRLDIDTEILPVRVSLSVDPDQEDTLAWLEWFHSNADFGPAHEDVIFCLQEDYEEKTGNRVPEGERIIGD